MTLRNGCRCHRHCDFFGVWSGHMAPAGSGPVYVCLQTIYGLNSGVFLSTLLHMPYPNRGVVWHSVQSVSTRLFTPFIAYFSAPQDMCICMLRIISPSAPMDCFSPPGECEWEYASALSRRVHAPT